LLYIFVTFRQRRHAATPHDAAITLSSIRRLISADDADATRLRHAAAFIDAAALIQPLPPHHLSRPPVCPAIIFIIIYYFIIFIFIYMHVADTFTLILRITMPFFFFFSRYFRAASAHMLPMRHMFTLLHYGGC